MSALALLAETVVDPRSLFTLCQIRNKSGELVDFNLHPEQWSLVDTYLACRENDQHLALLKSRQIGSSTLFAALLFWEWWASPGATTHVFFLHVQGKARKFASQWHVMYESLPESLRQLRPLSSDLTDSLVLADTGATITIGTAGGHAGARSASITTAVCSEYPFWATSNEKTKDILATILGSLVPGGHIVIESTAARYGDPLHEIFTGESSRYHCYFSHWWDHPEYSAEPPCDWRAPSTLSLPANLSLEQIYWYQSKLGELGESRMKREFPSSVEEAYDTSADAFLTQDDLKHVRVIDSDLELYRQPGDNRRGGPYAAGADAAFGVRKDFSSLVIVDCRTMQPVLRYRSNVISPRDFAKKVEEFCLEYQVATLLVESNQPGDQVLDYLVNNNTKLNLWKGPDFKDFVTTNKTKPLILQHLKDKILEGEIRELDHVTFADVCSLYTDGDKVINPRNEYGHGDSGFSAALAYWAAKDVKLTNAHLNPIDAWMAQQQRRRR